MCSCLNPPQHLYEPCTGQDVGNSWAAVCRSEQFVSLMLTCGRRSDIRGDNRSFIGGTRVMREEAEPLISYILYYSRRLGLKNIAVIYHVRYMTFSLYNDQASHIRVGVGVVTPLQGESPTNTSNTPWCLPSLHTRLVMKKNHEMKFEDPCMAMWVMVK